MACFWSVGIEAAATGVLAAHSGTGAGKAVLCVVYDGAGCPALPCRALCSGDVPVEYSGEEQAICCVGLATPKPGVFLSAIQHILVLATSVEVGRGLLHGSRPCPAPRQHSTCVACSCIHACPAQLL